MAMQGLTTMWLLLAMCVALGLAGLSVDLKVEPGSVVAGLTSSLTVNCSVFEDSNSTASNSTIEQPFTMIITLTNSIGNEMEIATISSLKDPHHPHLSDNGKRLKGVAEGYLDKNGEDSYLMVVFDYPTSNATGSYKCELTGMDDGFHVLKENEFNNITSRNVTVTDAVKGIQEHDKRISKLEHRMDAMFSRLDSFQEAVSSFMFTEKNTDYLVSRPIMQNAAIAESACQLLGGYLLEINDQDEFDYVSEHLNNATVKYNIDVLMGLNDEDGNWAFRENSADVPFWTGVSLSHVDGSNCGLMNWDDSWRFSAQPCYKNDKNVQFVCERPRV